MDKFTLTLAAATLAELQNAAMVFAVGTSPGISRGPIIDDADDTAPLNVNAPAVDGDGVPWDDRIHSSNKQMTDKGVWRRKRGVQDGEYTRITTELKQRAAMQAGVNNVTAAPAIPPQTMVIPAAVSIPTMPPGMPSPQPLPDPTPAPAAAGMTFPEFMAKYSAAAATGKVTQPELQAYLNACGIAQLGDLNNNPAAIQMVHDYMAANGKL